MIWRRRKTRATIRRLGAGDAALWRDLRLEALSRHPEAFGSSHDDWAGQPLEVFAARLEAGIVLGAFRDGTLIGSTALDPDSEAPRDGRLSAVYVDPAHRGEGIARALLRAAEARARSDGFARLVLCVAQGNEAALRFYEAEGFRIAGPEPRALTRDGQLLDVIGMVRPIRA
mgnify:CR=1 FL=1